MTSSKARQNSLLMSRISLHLAAHCLCLAALEHDLSHLLAVDTRVRWGVREHHIVVFGRCTEHVIEGVLPDLLHVVPVGDDTVCNRIGDGTNTKLSLCIVPDELLPSSSAGSANDRGEHRAGGMDPVSMTMIESAMVDNSSAV